MNSWIDEESEHTVAPWPGGQGGPHLLLRPVGKLSMLSEIVKVVGGGGGELKCCYLLGRATTPAYDFLKKFDIGVLQLLRYVGRAKVQMNYICHLTLQLKIF